MTLSRMTKNRYRILSRGFKQALQYAALIHAGQIRKSTEIPHVAHLLDFSINYDIKYRLGRDVESDEE